MKYSIFTIVILLFIVSCSNECEEADYIGEYKFTKYNDCSSVFSQNDLILTLNIKPKVGLIGAQKNTSVNFGLDLSKNKIEGWCQFSLYNLPSGHSAELRIKGKMAELNYRVETKKCETMFLEKSQ